ncbi:MULTISPECIES: DUF1178 family protein [Sediminimonas]|uniref:DUF1178 family protein n=1 Tax=Sediminimonas qiaohouensis TaxID=552061 RepID=A0A7C9L7D1_9RHOB|nr:MULTISPECIES: DUF1178 family protein [Sediminimonas]MDR9485159.1 DUF1178 family protein [Sediminimonas sp.]MTJ03634.1 DUF1178 family protein [Sediminimonas qiaohouensis]
MIQFSLKCDNDHRFDSWFQSASAFDKLKASGMVTCAVCGSANVEKALMAPHLNSGRASEGTEEPEPPKEHGALSAPATPAEQAMAELRRKIEANSDYVGRDFTTQARAMHEGTAPTRAIHGEAKPDEARKLLEDGVPVLPLPFRPRDKSN